tara:strand:+ start:527 stop:700 length:174 start_codon:yes stop_codon:yes gene_type:complete
MTLSEKLIKEFEDLTPVHQSEVVDFIEFLRLKESNNIENLMDQVINDNLEALEELAK